ncbi:uncharacterized protein [Notamacropus eugenii]|uniref:uncharacterized protein n=1 Tax=Notamacropus eugenii TaxID=9315 RepID=UPI003B680F51
MYQLHHPISPSPLNRQRGGRTGSCLEVTSPRPREAPADPCPVQRTASTTRQPACPMARVAATPAPKTQSFQAPKRTWGQYQCTQTSSRRWIAQTLPLASASSITRTGVNRFYLVSSIAPHFLFPGYFQSFASCRLGHGGPDRIAPHLLLSSKGHQSRELPIPHMPGRTKEPAPAPVTFKGTGGGWGVPERNELHNQKRYVPYTVMSGGPAKRAGV